MNVKCMPLIDSLTHQASGCSYRKNFRRVVGYGYRSRDYSAY